MPRTSSGIHEYAPLTNMNLVSLYALVAQKLAKPTPTDDSRNDVSMKLNLKSPSGR